jgi:hypothetical protein
MNDQLSPLNPYAAKLYYVFTKESKFRKGKDFSEWNESEIRAVWNEAKKIAIRLGKHEPSIEMIRQEEISASGHSDYGRKWAVNVFYRIEQCKKSSS